MELMEPIDRLGARSRLDARRSLDRGSSSRAYSGLCAVPTPSSPCAALASAASLKITGRLDHVLLESPIFMSRAQCPK
jgi:hypothetical protein